MSTRGSFMICRDGACKEMVIRYDAYPQGAGMDVVDLIKTKDLIVLYESMRIDRECGESAADFSYECCKAGGREEGYLPVRSGPEYFIQNSLFCEYGYVVDLDRQALQLYVGGQTSPQEDNRFGTESARNEFADKAYYPCRMKGVFHLIMCVLRKLNALSGRWRRRRMQKMDYVMKRQMEKRQITSCMRTHWRNCQNCFSLRLNG